MGSTQEMMMLHIPEISQKKKKISMRQAAMGNDEKYRCEVVVGIPYGKNERWEKISPPSIRHPHFRKNQNGRWLFSL
ncbi:hypothetical protein POVWA2_021590 [Plasmodium ovale wallikeri]|uniref:Uncharacterized protein n=1 Tax=Plasmodium ovale wallikeri TaxID=864142 RepID=A0A1A8YS23_PLAOA|nr:hypothetical protein POVWA1_021610 [Plasmodium ovale wallikeri]SBT34758.1 hypothetical protein POVWA2_021590 [Plasmodium ovale wallikeri]